jgi:hypothetical protein
MHLLKFDLNEVQCHNVLTRTNRNKYVDMQRVHLVGEYLHELFQIVKASCITAN